MTTAANVHTLLIVDDEESLEKVLERALRNSDPSMKVVVLRACDSRESTMAADGVPLSDLIQ